MQACSCTLSKVTQTAVTISLLLLSIQQHSAVAAPAPATFNTSAVQPVNSNNTTSIPTTPVQTEQEVLQRLGWQRFYTSAEYSITTVLPANCTSGTWQSLGGLASLTRLTLTGQLPDLPDTWAANGSFLSLQHLNLSNSQLAGTQPLSWGQPGAWSNLSQLLLDYTAISGSLPSSWGAPSAFPKVSFLGLGLTGDSALLG